MRRLATALGSLAFASFASFVSVPAMADCIPGTGLCASIDLSAALPVVPAVQVGGQVSIGLPPIVLPPFPQIPLPGVPVAPPAAPAAPVIVYTQPGYSQPAYGQPMYGQPMYGQPYAYAPPQPIYYGAGRAGLDLRLDGALGFGRGHSAYGLAGAGVGLRYHGAPYFGFELGFDMLGGRDYNDQKRFELAGTAGGLLYFNPRSRAQVYLSAGMLADYARATPAGSFSSPGAHEYTHLGGYGGLGLELFATPRLAFHFDARGVVRQRIGSDADKAPEFTDPATGRTTNTSAGMVGTAGVVFYF